MKSYLLLLIIVVLVHSTLLFCGCGPSTTSPTTSDNTTITNPTTLTVGTNVGDLAADFQLQDLEGSSILLSDFRGSPVVINFWKTT